MALPPEAEAIVAGGDGWIAWTGNAMPVDGTDEVEVRYRAPANPAKGTRIEGPVLALMLNWSHDGEDDDIIAYRVVPA